MNPTIVLLGLCLLAVPEFGQTADISKRLTVPGVVGVFQRAWDPLLPTDRGFIYSVGYYLDGDQKTTPIVVWIPDSGDRTPLEIKSLASINIVAEQIAASRAPSFVLRTTIESVRRFIANTFVNKGRGGFSLDPDASNPPKRVFSFLRKAGLGESELEMLKDLLRQAQVKIGEKEWTKCWFEIDSLGSVEKITIAGTVEPPAVKSLHVESVFDAGRIDVEILKKASALDEQSWFGP